MGLGGDLQDFDLNNQVDDIQKEAGWMEEKLFIEFGIIGV